MGCDDGAKRPEIETGVKVGIIFAWPQPFLLDKEHICKPSVVKPSCNGYKGALIFPEWHNLRSLFWENYTLCYSQSNVHHPGNVSRKTPQAYSVSPASISHDNHLSNRILMVKIISKIISFKIRIIGIKGKKSFPQGTFIKVFFKQSC